MPGRCADVKNLPTHTHKEEANRIKPKSSVINNSQLKSKVKRKTKYFHHKLRAKKVFCYSFHYNVTESIWEGKEKIKKQPSFGKTWITQTFYPKKDEYKGKQKRHRNEFYPVVKFSKKKNLVSRKCLLIDYLNEENESATLLP